MSLAKQQYAQPDNFDWSAYEDGWNGRSLKVNKSVKTKNKKDKIYCHESYAQDLYKRFTGEAPVSKEVRANTIVNITGFDTVSKDELLVSVSNGANNLVIDLNKEQRFFNTLQLSNGERMTKESFIACLQDPEAKQSLLSMNLKAKVGSNKDKGSIWDGYVESMKQEMIEQITKKNKAYMATIISANDGGFVVNVADTLNAFMPGSMAAANKITDYQSLVGTTMEVMVESYNPKMGFVVSRKKFLHTMLPVKLRDLQVSLKENPDQTFKGTVTGFTPFGVFVELDEYITGMLHKTLVSDETRDGMRNKTIQAGSEIDVFIHKIENNRVILSDVPSDKREEVIKRREAEDEAEKAAANQLQTITLPEDTNEVFNQDEAENA
jgi:predicted RNA-binding protein with RPS1 domain